MKVFGLFKKEAPAQPTNHEKLVLAKAELARIEIKPESDFSYAPGLLGGIPLPPRHGVDEKPKAIARKKADIAYLETLLKEETS